MANGTESGPKQHTTLTLNWLQLLVSLVGLVCVVLGSFQVMVERIKGIEIRMDQNREDINRLQNGDIAIRGAINTNSGRLTTIESKVGLPVNPPPRLEYDPGR